MYGLTPGIICSSSIGLTKSGLNEYIYLTSNPEPASILNSEQTCTSNPEPASTQNPEPANTQNPQPACIVEFPRIAIKR